MNTLVKHIQNHHPKIWGGMPQAMQDWLNDIRSEKVMEHIYNQIVTPDGEDCLPDQQVGTALNNLFQQEQKSRRSRRSSPHGEGQSPYVGGQPPRSRRDRQAPRNSRSKAAQQSKPETFSSPPDEEKSNVSGFFNFVKNLFGGLFEKVVVLGALFFKAPSKTRKWILIGLGILVLTIVGVFTVPKFLGNGGDEFVLPTPPADTTTRTPTGKTEGDENGEAETKGGKPNTPQADDAIDAGSTTWKSNSQWLQITFLAGAVTLLFIDTSQKKRDLKEDTRRGGGKKIRLQTIWVAPIFIILGVLVLVGTEWKIFQPVLFEAGHKLAITYALIFWFVGFLIAEGDPSYPATGITVTALWHLLTTQKTGALIVALKIPQESVMFNVKNTFDLLTLNSVDQAKFSLLIYGLLILAGFLLGRDLLTGTDRRDPGSFVGVLVAIIGGLTIFAAGRYIQPVWSLVILLGAGLGSQAMDVEKFDEGLMGAIIVGSILNLALAIPVA